MDENKDENKQEILNLRKQQDEINDKLAELLLQRLALSRKILQLKEKNGTPVRDFEREKEIICRVAGRVTRQVTSCSRKENETEYLSKIFETIFQQTIFQQTEKGS